MRALGSLRRWAAAWRPSVVTAGFPTLPLFVLFGLNAVDELDRTAFSVLLPDIRDDFGLSNTGALSIVSATTIAVLIISVPLSFYCDRANRVRIATTGGAVWGFFSVATGLALTPLMLVLTRIGAGTGRAVVEPTHNSLLSDYYPPQARVKVFSFHRQANSVGQIIGPIAAGTLAYFFGWRTPFIVFAVPTAIVVLFALRLREPVRGVHERLAAGLDEEAAQVPDAPEGIRSTMVTLARVRTIRRVWLAVPFLGVALFGVQNLLSLIYEEVFDLDSLARGWIAAGVEPLQVVGVLVTMPWVARMAMKDPGYLLRFVGLVGLADAVCLVVFAYAPNLAVAIAMHALVAASIGTLAPSFFALLSLVAPPRVRSAGLTTIAVFAVPGIAVFLPLIGVISDTHGIRVSMLVLVPIAVAAGFILSTAAKFVLPDIAAAHAESLARAEVQAT
jgi:branched-chain amino acid transport system ATP-binding protein